jgi:hypothetical protein
MQINDSATGFAERLSLLRTYNRIQAESYAALPLHQFLYIRGRRLKFVLDSA